MLGYQQPILVQTETADRVPPLLHRLLLLHHPYLQEHQAEAQLRQNLEPTLSKENRTGLRQAKALPADSIRVQKQPNDNRLDTLTNEPLPSRTALYLALW